MSTEAQWFRSSPRGNAHLARASAGPNTYRTWCDITVSTGIDGQFAPRCTNCLRNLSRFADEALTNPPDRVEHVIVLRVVTSTEPSPEDVLQDVLTRVRRRTSWGVAGMTTSSAPYVEPEPEPESEGWPADAPHSRACGARAHEHGTDCHANCPTCGGKA